MIVHSPDTSKDFAGNSGGFEGDLDRVGISFIIQTLFSNILKVNL